MFSEINGLKIFYERHLGADAVVVMHGWGGSHKTTKCIYELLGKWNYDVINIDFPGFGDSDEPKDFGIYDYAQVVQDLAKKLKLNSVTLVGHSFGGRVALILANKPWVKRIVLIDSAGIKPRRTLTYRLNILKYKRAKRKNKDLSNFGSSDYRALNDNMKGIFVRVVNEHLDGYAKKINKPCCIFWGKNDYETPFYMAKKLNKYIKNSKLFLLDGGHYSYIDDFTDFAVKLTTVLKGEG
ncbi:MAG: alpha/beta hydrolase [Clostridia bacterium]|nr:alpha/beta hydrolase [Clostridia bacterium]